MTAPLVTAIVPAFDAAATIERAVRSILDQPHRPLEVVVVDDGSRDATAEIARALGAVVLRQPNRGPSAARNAGIAVARGELLAFLDADDTWVPGRLGRAVAVLVADPTLEVVLGAARWVGWPDAELARYRFGGGEPSALVPHLAAGVYRRQVFERIGLLDEGLWQFEDHDWFLRARERDVRMVALREVVFERRWRPGSLSRAPDRDRRALHEVLRRSAVRRRASGRGELPRLADYLVEEDRCGS